MNNESMQPIGTSPKFDRLVKPMDRTEREKMKKELTDNMDARIIHTWRGKHLLDRERYELCAELSLDATISEQYFEDWTGAAEYICREQLKTLPEDCKYRRYLIGQIFQYILNRNNNGDNAGKKMEIAEEVGKEWDLSGLTVSRYGFYAGAINDIFSQSEELARLILSEKMSISRENVMELSHLKGEELRAIAKTIEAEDVTKISLSFIRSEVKLCHIKKRGHVSRKEKLEKRISEDAGIRQMPKYDPDSGVNSLCMTIESWISSIQRVKESEDFCKISENAGLRLIKRLSELEFTINGIQELLIERTAS